MSILGLSLVGDVPSQAEDLGVWGETFAIEEEDLLEHIFSRLKNLKESGKFEEIKRKTEERIQEMILHPVQMHGISVTTQKREYTFDPTIIVTRDLADRNGRIFAKKGEKFNPLERISMKPLLFIDGEDRKQIKWALSKINDQKVQKHNMGKIILIKGSPLNLQNELGREIYFDQYGVLITKFGIKHVPAIVFQKPEEKTLTIIEDIL